MAYIQWLDEDIPSKKRAKVCYDVKTLDGTRRRKSKTFKPGTPVKTIKAYCRKVEEEYETSEGMDYRKRTLEDFIKEYFDTFSEFLSPATIRSYRQVAEGKKNGLITHLGKIELSKLSSAHVQNYVNYLLGEGLSPKTIKNNVMVLHSIYDRALRLHYVPKSVNVVSLVDIPKVRKRKIESYSLEEVQTLLRLADQYATDRLRLQIYLAVGTGARRSELAALKIESVDFEHRVLHITESKVSLGGTKPDVVKEPKTDAGMRDIPLGDVLIRELKKAVVNYNKNKIRHGSEFEDSRYIFSDEYGHPYRTDTMTGTWREFMKKHEDEIRYLSFHSLRHTYASLAVANKIDIKCLQEILGHSDASTTLNIYANSYFEKKQEYADVVDKTIFAKQA